MHRNTSRLVLLAATLVAFAVLSGCGDDTFVPATTISADGGSSAEGGNDSEGGSSPTTATTTTVTSTSSTTGTGGNSGEGGTMEEGGGGGFGGTGGSEDACPAWQSGSPLACGSWTSELAPSPLSLLYSIGASSPTDIFAVGGTYNVGKVIHNNGSGWIVQETPPTRVLEDVIVFASNDVWAVGRGPAPDDDGIALHYNGLTWSIVPNTPSVTYGGRFTDIWGTSSSNLYVLGWDYTHAVLFHWDGTQWTDMELPKLPPKSEPGDIWGTEEGLVWVVGSLLTNDNSLNGSVIYHYDGSVWTSSQPVEAAGSGATLLSIHGTDACHILASGTKNDSGTLKGVAMRWDGSSWSALSSPDVSAFTAVVTAGVHSTLFLGNDPVNHIGKIGLSDGIDGFMWSSGTMSTSSTRAAFRIPGTKTHYIVGDGSGGVRIDHADCQ